MAAFRQHAPSLWRKIFGWGCVLLGVLGLILPIIPGIPFLIIGLMALATQHRWARALLVWSKRKFRAKWPRRTAAEPSSVKPRL